MLGEALGGVALVLEAGDAEAGQGGHRGGIADIYAHVRSLGAAAKW